MTPAGILVTPLIGAVLIALVGRWPNLREAVTMVSAGVLFVLVCLLVPEVLAGGRPALTLFSVLPGLEIRFELEPLGMIFAIVASFLWIVTSIYSISYMRTSGASHQTRYFACFALAIGSAMAIASAGNLFTLFIFYEVLTLSTYPLVTHYGTQEAMRGGRVYLGILLTTSIGLQLVAIVWTYLAAGTLDFRIGGILDGNIAGALVPILLLLYVYGIGKAAVMPLHRWLPSAMVAPAPVSALLHAVAVVKAGVFSVLKVCVYIFGVDFLATTEASQWIAYLAGITIVVASLVALSLDNLKARLAYSTIGQLSYIVLGALLANAAGVIGGALHIVMHAFGKITLFLCAGAIYLGSKQTVISATAGLGRQMPWTFAFFFIASLSIIGLPPTGGTWSKWYLALGTIEADQWFLLGALLISSLLNVWYLLEIPMRAFLSPADPEIRAKTREAPLPCLIAMGITTLGCVVLFFWPDLFYSLASQVVP